MSRLKSCENCEYFMDNGADCCSLLHKNVTRNNTCNKFLIKKFDICIERLVITYLAIREPLLWISLLICFISSSVIGKIAFWSWVFCIIFSESSMDRYMYFKKEYKIK